MPDPVPGSPEAVAAALKAKQEADEAAAALEQGSDGDGDGDGTVTLTKAEHDALQANARLFKKQERERKQSKAAEDKAAAKKAAQKQLDAAEAAGLGKDLQEANAAKESAEAAARTIMTERSVELLLRERDWTEEARDLAVAQLDLDDLDVGDNGLPTDEAINEALDDLAERYPKTFSTTPQRGDGAGKEPGVKTNRAKRTPANPTLNEAGGDPKFEGYVSPEDFMNASQELRQDPSYWARVEKSRMHWPDKFNHRLLREE